MKRCKNHPRYKGIYRSRTGCPVCQEIYDLNHEAKLQEIRQQHIDWEGLTMAMMLAMALIAIVAVNC